MRVAVVSQDNENIDEHFGKAERFLIYEVDNESFSFVEERKSTPLSEGDPKHPFNSELFGYVYNLIKDCKGLLCVQIGNRPGKELRERGIEPIVYLGTIEEGLKKAAILES